MNNARRYNSKTYVLSRCPESIIDGIKKYWSENPEQNGKSNIYAKCDECENINWLRLELQKSPTGWYEKETISSFCEKGCFDKWMNK